MDSVFTQGDEKRASDFLHCFYLTNDEHKEFIIVFGSFHGIVNITVKELLCYKALIFH